MLFYKANEPLGNHIKKIIISRKSQPPAASCQPPVANRHQKTNNFPDMIKTVR